MNRTEGERLTKRADAPRVEGGRRRMRWEDCVKRDLAGIGRENESEGWGGGDGSETGSMTTKRKTKTVDWYPCQPHPRLPG